MVRETAATGRVLALREKYMQCPMMKYNLPYKRAMRQKLLFLRGWVKYREKPTTRLRRAYAEAYLLEHMHPVFFDDELIVGQPDFTPLTAAEQEEFDRLTAMEPASPKVSGRTDHMSLDYEKLLKVGVKGLMAEVCERRAALDLNDPDDIRKDEFYEGCYVELLCCLMLAEKYEKALREKGLTEQADILAKVPANPATTFREALQSIHFYNFTLWGQYQIGRPDQYLLPYYEADIQSGRMTVEQAQELIDCFCMMYTTYITSLGSIGFMVGGRDREGNLVCNDLTYLFLYSIGHTRTSDPSIGLCLSSESDENLLKVAVDLLAKGYTHPAIYNDDAITEAMRQAGFAKADCHDYIHSACVEITPCARSGIWTVSPYHNLLGILRQVIFSEKEYASVEEVLADFKDLLRKEVIRGNNNENLWQLERSRNGGEVMRVSCLVNDCLARGKSVDEGGALYNHIQPDFLGMPNTVDMLEALKLLVFDSGEYTLADIRRILDTNFEGEEALRQRIIHKLPHYGNNEPDTDALSDRVTSIIAECCEGIATFRGATLLPGMFSYNRHELYGRETGATLDGRLAGTPLADGSSPVQGREMSGPTASVLSSTAWDHKKFLGGIAVNMKFTKKQMSGEAGTKLAALIKTFLQRGGFEIQLNCIDPEDFKKAQQHPEDYADLVVRIGGYSEYFTKLNRNLQDEIIERNAHMV